MYSLLTNVAEGLAGMAILHQSLAWFRSLPSDWFKFTSKGKWQCDVGGAASCFLRSIRQVLNLFPVPPSKPVTVLQLWSSQLLQLAREPVPSCSLFLGGCSVLWGSPRFFDQIDASLMHFHEFNSFCHGALQFPENAASFVSWDNNGCCLCAIKKPVGF